MHRRTLLAGIGALSTGCLGTPPRQTNNSAQPPDNHHTLTATAVATCETWTETPSTDASVKRDKNAEYRLTDLSVSTSTDRPSAKYVLEPSAFYSGEAVDREEERTGEEHTVEDISAIDDDEVRAAIETAIRTGDWRSNTLPDGLDETVERVDFFTGVSEDDTYTHVGLTLYRLHPDRPPAIEFSARIVDDIVSEESSGALELALTNRSQTAQTVFSGTVPPFGMVFAESVERDETFLLWRDYEEEGCIDFTDDGWIRCAIGIMTELGPCERIRRRYEVLPSGTSHHPDQTVPPGPGTYRFAGSVSYYEESGAPESELSYEVELSLEAVE